MNHVAVLDPGTRIPELDCFNRMSRAATIPLTYHLPAIRDIDSLQRQTDGVVGIVILGSGASVHENADWQLALDDWLLPKIEEGVPVLGLCYGHQHLAHRLGGAVDFLFEDRHKLRGVRRITLATDRLWGATCSGEMVVSHREIVTQLPDGFVGVASAEDVPFDAMLHPERPIWGFQPHPEATTAFTTGNGIPFDADPAILGFGHSLVDRFIAFCAEHA